jgi:hypothetical protein
MSVRQQSIQWAGFYVAGVLCLGLTVLKLTMEGHWSWWRVLLPLWAILGHNIFYIAVGFTWLSFVSQGAPEHEEITVRDPPFGYELGAMFCMLLFAHNLLRRIERPDQQAWAWLGSGQWQLLLLFGILNLVCQLLFWSEAVRVNHRSTRRT